MKKNNFVIISVSLLTLSSCSGLSVHPKMATASKPQAFVEEEATDRKVASEDSDERYKMCFESRFNIATLKNEVSDYESKVIGTPVQGSWKHLNLESLPIPQANFLKKYGESIGDIKNPESIN